MIFPRPVLLLTDRDVLQGCCSRQVILFMNRSEKIFSSTTEHIKRTIVFVGNEFNCQLRSCWAQQMLNSQLDSARNSNFVDLANMVDYK